MEYSLDPELVQEYSDTLYHSGLSKLDNGEISEGYKDIVLSSQMKNYDSIQLLGNIYYYGLYNFTRDVIKSLEYYELLLYHDDFSDFQIIENILNEVNISDIYYWIDKRNLFLNFNNSQIITICNLKIKELLDMDDMVSYLEIKRPKSTCRKILYRPAYPDINDEESKLNKKIIRRRIFGVVGTEVIKRTDEFIIRMFTPYDSDIKSKGIQVPVGDEIQNPSMYYASVYMTKNNRFVLNHKIGDVGEYSIEFKLLRYKYEIFRDTDYEISNYLSDLSKDTRIEYVNRDIFTIDSHKCKHHDDAINYNPSNHSIGIHIADVSSYVPYMSVLDKLAKKQSETVYIPQNNTVGLYPTDLTEIMSLNEGQMSRSLSLIIYLDTNDNIESFEFIKTKIMVTKNLTFDEANQYIDENHSLNILYRLCEKLSNDYGFNTNNTYNLNKMIEILMIMANHFAIVFIDRADRYTPISKMFRDFNSLTESNSYEFGALDQNSEFNTYTHFTCPLRRYIDIINHRMITNILENRMEPIDVKVSDLEHFTERHEIIKQIDKDVQMLFRVYELKDRNQEINTLGRVVSVSYETIRVLTTEFGIIEIDMEDEYDCVNGERVNVRLSIDIERPFNKLVGKII